MSRLVFTPLAEDDLQCILDYIAQDRPGTAVQIVSEIRRKCALANSPLIGQPRPDISPVHRCSTWKRWVIFYRVVGDVVEIHRVLDGAQDAEAIFDQ